MNRLLNETSRRLKEELKKVEELKKRVKTQKRPPTVDEVKKIVDNIKSVEQQMQHRYIEATEQATEAADDDDDIDDEEEESPKTKEVEMTSAVEEEGDYVPPTESEPIPEPADADDDEVVLPPSRKRKRRNADDDGGSGNPFKDKAVENKIKSIHGRAKAADGKVMVNPFAHLKKADEFFVEHEAPKENPEDADESKLLTKGSKMDFYPTVVPSAALAEDPIVSALTKMNFNVAKTIPYWLQSNLNESYSFSKLVEDFKSMQAQLKNKNSGLLMAVRLFDELAKATPAIHEFTANKEEIKEIKASLSRDIGDKKPAKEALKHAMGAASSAHSKLLVEAVFNAVYSKK